MFFQPRYAMLLTMSPSILFKIDINISCITILVFFIFYSVSFFLNLCLYTDHKCSSPLSYGLYGNVYATDISFSSSISVISSPQWIDALSISIQIFFPGNLVKRNFMNTITFTLLKYFLFLYPNWNRPVKLLMAPIIVVKVICYET